MNDHEIAKRLADIIGLRVTEDMDGDRPIWLLDGKVEWNPVRNITQLWPLVKRFRVWVSDGYPEHDNKEWVASCSPHVNEAICEHVSLEHAIALAIIEANDPCREGR